jgi:hypothetical protein
MQISMAKGNLKLESEKATAFLIFNSAEIEAGQLNIGPVKSDQVLCQPGEYEYGDVSVVALETDQPADDVSDVFNISLEGVSTAYFMPKSTPASDDFEDLGEIDMLVLNLSEEVDQKLISRIDPRIVICINASAEAAEKILGVAPAVEKKLKFKDSEFTAEEYETKYFLLTD